ncbi:phosphatidylglycerol lysyltransferase domain-containing protein [Sabulicella rubraurantiaca]|uniref:phosphatidylglycerol lysyltransferase domain-containing protein n=1 Tax=Sabulicella rubraurantiaca TaxID=2811429 RepID=UPI002E2CED01|nr:phosphatidylglycerol lysyltransferase domain-containing protein [Sabulicella rubraurantiaca]
MRSTLPLLKRHGPTVFGLLLLVGAVYVVQREFRSLSVADVTRAMGEITTGALWLGAGFTVIAYLVLAIYDWLGARYAGRPSSWGRALLASFCGYSLAHNLGFAAVSGAAVRFRLYSAWGYTPLEIGKVIGFTSLTFGLGGMALGGAVLTFEPEVLPWVSDHVPRWALQLTAVPLFGVVTAYVLLSRFRRTIRFWGHEVELPSTSMALAQTVLAAVDVAVTAAIFYVLLPPAEGLTFLRFIGIYLAAYAAGIAAHVPGGLGVFDGAIMIGLAPYLGTAEVVGALLVFRLFYYIIPLFIAGFLFAGFELGQRRAALAGLSAFGRGAMPLEVPVLAGLVALGGGLLIFLGALPVRQTVLLQWAGYEAALASQLAASVVGSLLLVISYGLLRRLTLAWGAAIFLLLNGAAIAGLRAEEWWTWGAFLLVAGFLATMRSAFYRDSRLVAEPLSQAVALPLLAVGFCGLTLALVAYGGRVADAAWWEVPLSRIAPAQLRFTVGLTGLLLLFGTLRLLRPVRIRPAPFDAAARLSLLAAHGSAPVAGDAVIRGERGEAALVFTRGKEVWAAQGDPQGPRDDAVSAIWRFRDLCERNGVRPAFLDATERFGRIYADIGLQMVEDPARPGRLVACVAEHDLANLTGSAPVP